MYSQSEARGARHESITSTADIGTLSYIGIEAYRVLAGHIFASDISPNWPTFLRTPRTHIIFSLASWEFKPSEVANLKFLALEPQAGAAEIVNRLLADVEMVVQAVQASVRARTQGQDNLTDVTSGHIPTPASAAQPVTTERPVESESDEDEDGDDEFAV